MWSWQKNPTLNQIDRPANIDQYWVSLYIFSENKQNVFNSKEKKEWRWETAAAAPVPTVNGGKDDTGTERWDRKQ